MGAVANCVEDPTVDLLCFAVPSPSSSAELPVSEREAESAEERDWVDEERGLRRNHWSGMQNRMVGGCPHDLSMSTIIVDPGSCVTYRPGQRHYQPRGAGIDQLRTLVSGKHLKHILDLSASTRRREKLE